MATKTISLRLEAYERLRTARRYPDESFSQVILRARWPEETVSAADLLARRRETGPLLSDEILNTIENLKRTEGPPADKWTAP
jgi:predicted CopG family antitoxin